MYTMKHETDKGSEVMSSPTPTEVLSNLECCDHIPYPAEEPTKPESSELMKIPSPSEVLCSPESEVLNNPESSSDQIPSAAEEALTKEDSSSVESKIPSPSIAAEEAPTKQELSSVESKIHSPSIAVEATNTRTITTSSSFKRGNSNNPKKRRLSDYKGARSRPVMAKRPRRFTAPIGNDRRPVRLPRDRDMQHTHGSVRRDEMPCDLYEKEYRAFGPGQGRRPVLHYGDVYEREHLPNPAYTAGASRHELRPLALVDLYGRDPRYNRDYHQRRGEQEQVPMRPYFDPMQENRAPHDRGESYYSGQWGHAQAAVNDRMRRTPLSYIQPQTCPGQQVSKTVTQHRPHNDYSFASASYSSYR